MVLNYNRYVSYVNFLDGYVSYGSNRAAREGDANTPSSLTPRKRTPPYAQGYLNQYH